MPKIPIEFQLNPDNDRVVMNGTAQRNEFRLRNSRLSIGGFELAPKLEGIIRILQGCEVWIEKSCSASLGLQSDPEP